VDNCITVACTKCKQEYPLTKEYFQPAKGYRLGFNTQCRCCRRKAAKHHPNRKTEKHKETKALRSKNPDVSRRRNERRKERYATDPEFREYILTHAKASKVKNPELHKENKKREYQKNKDKYKESARKNYLKHRDKYIERSRNAIRDPVKRAIDVQRRLARKRQLPDTFTKEQWILCLSYFHNQCVICGRMFDDKCKPYMDHWIPLKNLECPGTVAWNIVCMCGGKGGCNESKHSHDAKKWLLDFYPPEQAQEIFGRVEEYLRGVKE
jgi:hypothetical protein